MNDTSERARLHDDLRRAARQHSGVDVVRWAVTRKPQKWPRWTSIEPRRPEQRISSPEPVCTVVNHSTVLVQWHGWNVLTDPIWSKRCSPSQWAGPARVHAPAVRFDDLPAIDLVLLSHDHYDHCDAATLKRLLRRPGGDATRFVTGSGVGRLLKRWGAAKRQVHECDWWGEVNLVARDAPSASEGDTNGVDLRCTFLPVQHFTGRGLTDRNRAVPGAFALQPASADDPQRCIVYGADTGYHPELFPAWRDALPPVDLALLPIGAYLPRWFMGPVHMDPSDAVRAHRELGAKQSIGIHWGTFQLTDEAREAPVQELQQALAEQGVPPSEFRCLEFGVSWPESDRL